MLLLLLALFTYAQLVMVQIIYIFFYRLLLAALHFNQNGSREVTRTMDGEVLCGSLPKVPQRWLVVRPVKEKPSYG